MSSPIPEIFHNIEHKCYVLGVMLRMFATYEHLRPDVNQSRRLHDNIDNTKKYMIEDKVIFIYENSCLIDAY